MKKSFVLLLIILAVVARADNEIGFIEKFALAPDRGAVLTQLIPGSEDYYFFHALHFQNTAQKTKLRNILEQWKARFPQSGQRHIIENREALLAYDADPKATLQFLRDRLNLEFNHEQQARDKKPDLPTALDPARISREAFQRETLRDSDDLAQFSDEALEALVRAKTPLLPPQQRALLQRLQRPDLPGLVELIVADLKRQESKGFGEFDIHRALLPEQLDELAKQMPALTDNQAFVFTRLRKMFPSADADAEFDPVEREAWLERIWAYAKNLGPAFNTLKAHILYARLQHDRTRGVYDKTRFIEYLKLPRRLGYVREEYLNRTALAAHPVDLSANLAEVLIGAAPIGNDEWLVREYLLQLLKDEPAWEPWAVYLRDSFVKALFGESKIVHGIGDPERWAALLTPSGFQQLKDRVDIDFAPTNPQFHAPADDVALDLLVKNAPKLIVKIYEINALSFFLTQNRQLNTDINLDGLVANAEKTHDFTAEPAGANPFRRNARKFTFPELKGRRGAWVIEFIGAGKSSRALIRKGQWHLLQQTGPAGEILRIVDEAHQPVEDAVVWLDGRKFTHPPAAGLPDPLKWAINVPFTTQPGTKPIILADNAGQFATLTSFEHHAEQYALDAQFHIEREQLLARREATVAVRAVLLLGNVQVAPSLLKEAKLKITSTTLDGVSTTHEVTDIKLDPAKVFTHTFTVPERIGSLTVLLSGKIDKLSAGGEKQDLAASRTWSLNGIDKTDATADGHFSQFDNRIVFELLGKNGEPIPDQQVVFDVKHHEFARPIQAALRTDERGRVEFGPLVGIEHVKATMPGDRVADCHFGPGLATPKVIHAKSGTVVRTPWPGAAAKLVPADVSLLEKRGDSFSKNYFAALSLSEGFIEIKGLPPGDYSLLIRGEARTEIEIRVTAGDAVADWLLGASRHLELRHPAPLQIQSVALQGDSVVVQLRNANKFTRVHVAATRFISHDNIFESLAGFTGFVPGIAGAPQRPNLFIAGRAIGDEFRYILERRYARLFPGNMLKRPELLLNPWEVRSTDLLEQTMATGQAAARSAGDREKKLKQAAKAEAATASAPAPAQQIGSNLDFLANAAPTIYNLVPDANGVVKIDRKLLGDRQHVHVYAEDLTSAVLHEAALPEAPTKFQDLRLARNLDPQKHFTERKQVSVIAAGKALTLVDILTSELQTYDSLASVHSLFTTLSGNGHLATFAWILQWPKLKDEEKQAKYSEFACHELNFFLSRKDPPFFQQVIQPYLRNKKDKTFIDEYLLGSDLRRHLEPWAYARLNAAERVLLAQRLPGEAAATARHLRELYDLLPPNVDRNDFLFETALRGQALEGGGAFGEAIADALHPAAALEVANAPAAPAATPALAGRAPLSRRGLEPSQLALQIDDMNTLAKKLDSPADKDVAARVRNEGALGGAKTADLYAFGLETDALKLREQVRQFYRALGPTKEWAENNYYKLPIVEQTADLIPINAFWRDFAAWDGKTPFLSEHLAEASRNFSEMMLALAVLDLPFEAGKHETKAANGQFTITAASPLIAFHKEIKVTAPIAVAAPGGQQGELLVSENFFRHGDRHRIEGNEKFDKYVTEEFLAGIVYGGNVVVTNPTSTPQKLEVLLQVPRGALPVLGSKATDSKRPRLEPYSTQTFEYFFYFPVATAPNAEPFPHFPVHVARNEQMAGSGKPLSFKVVNQLSKIDTGSWDYVSQYGSEAEVFAFLEQANLGRITLEQVAWRARKSVDFFRKLIALLEKRHVYDEVIYRYAIVHNERGPLREWLRHRDDFLAQCGPWFGSTLVTIDPIERRAYEHLEYSPLVNQRAHKLGGEARIANPVFRAQFQALLRIIAHKPALDAIDEMSVVYYLLLQDRIEEALTRFAGIKAEALPTRLQHDYFRCYAAFYEEKLADARAISAQHATHPVDRWRKLFNEVTAQLDEIEGKVPPRKGDGQPNREAQQSELATTEPAFDFKVENRTIALTWRNLGEVTINYYLMDPEFLFSSSPFVTEDPGRFAIIKPSKTAKETLPAGKDALEIALPAEFHRANVLVEILGAGQRKAQAYHANTLKLNLTENYGRLEVREQAANKTIPKAYVKVYARLKSGAIRFFKDGYTDLRGKFDYVSLNSSDKSGAVPEEARRAAPAGEGIDHQMLRPNELGQVDKLAILVLTETNGALVREVNPPSE